jgi:WD40 repeat protein
MTHSTACLLRDEAGAWPRALSAPRRRAPGSEDGTVRVWELRSGQAVHVMAGPAKGPVTALLVLDRPPLLAAHGGRGSSGEAGALPSLFCAQ